MTLQEFEKLRLGLEREQFQGESVDPLLFGIERGQFERKRLQKLIDLGDGVRSKTVQAKVERWKRQLKRLDDSITRLEKLKDEIRASHLQIVPNNGAKVFPNRLRFE